MKIKIIIIKETFGNIEGKPANRKAKQIAKACGCKTFNSLQIKILQSVGYQIEVVRSKN